MAARWAGDRDRLPIQHPRDALRRGFGFEFLGVAFSGSAIPPGTIGAFVALPDFYQNVMRPLFQHHMRPCNGVEQ